MDDDRRGAHPRVLIVARRALDRAGLQGLAGDLAVGACATWREADRQVEALDADLILAAWEDLGVAETLLPLSDGLVLLGDDPSPAELRALLQAGLRGFLLADAEPAAVGAALAAAAAGLLTLDPLLLDALSAPTTPEMEGPAEALTPRELEVLDLVARGLSNPEIAAVLGFSARTAKFHVSSLLTKLEAGSRTEAVTLAMRMGLLSL